MKLKIWYAMFGAFISTGMVTTLYFWLGISWVSLATVTVLCLVGYIAGSLSASSSTVVSAFGELMRGFLLGMNAASNAFLGSTLLSSVIGSDAALSVGIALGLLNLLAVIGPVSQSEVYQFALGWLTWVMPMSWLVIALGLVFLIFSAFLTIITGGKVEYLRVQALRMDWKTGTTFVRGGLIANLNYLDTAFNMGNFSFVDAKSNDWHIDHEAGHTLNLAAFGSVFHLIGAFDENVLGRGHQALAERIADSNSCSGGSNIPMWI